MSAAKNWCFTLNNYTEKEYVQMCNYGRPVTYICIGKEVGEKGTPHLQGYISLEKKQKIPFLKKLNSRAHWEIAKGTPQQNYEYCTKQCTEDNKPFIHGNIPTQKGKKSNETRLNKMYEEIMECPTWGDVLRLDGVHRCMTYAREVWNNKPLPKMDEPVLRPLQNYLKSLLDAPADSRHIYYVYDQKGNVGKTFFATYMAVNHKAFVINPAKSADIFYMYKNQRIIIYDIPRTTDDRYVNWGALEKLKDGYMVSGKYDSCIKYRPEPAHIMVFSNHILPDGIFSDDRIIHINAQEWNNQPDNIIKWTVQQSNTKQPEAPNSTVESNAQFSSSIGGEGFRTLKPEAPILPSEKIVHVPAAQMYRSISPTPQEVPESNLTLTVNF